MEEERDSSSENNKGMMGLPEHNWEKHYNLKEGDIYMEGGAFYGRYGYKASQKVGSSGKVILVEPVPKSVEVINAGIKENNLSNVVVIPKAFWSTSGVRDFIVWGDPTASRLAFPSDKVNYPDLIIEVKVITVDELVEELGLTHIDLLAADVELAECEMMKGSLRSLDEKKIRNVAIAAYHHPPNPSWIKGFLLKRGCSDIKYEEGVVYAKCQ